MTRELTHEEKTFMKAYQMCMGNAPQNEIEYYFQNKEKAQIGTSAQQREVTEEYESWSRIEDGWLLWREAAEYAKKPPIKTYKVTASYSTQCSVEIEAESEDEAYRLAKEMDGGNFETEIDGGDWQIEHITEVKPCTT